MRQSAECSRLAATQHRRRFDEVALYEVHADVSQPVEIVLLFDLLRNDPKLHRSRQFDHGIDHLLVDGVGRKAVRIATVDLQVIDRQLLEAGERAQPAAKVVQGELTANTVQHFDEPARVLEIALSLSSKQIDDGETVLRSSVSTM